MVPGSSTDPNYALCTLTRCTLMYKSLNSPLISLYIIEKMGSKQFTEICKYKFKCGI